MSSKYLFLGLRGHALRAAQIIFVVGPGFTLFGYNQAGVGPLATLQTWVSTFPTIDTINTEGAQEAVNSTRKGAVIASFQIGALIGALSCLFLGDRLGRRKTIFLAAILTIIGEALQVSAYNVIQFVVGRVILGIGVGEISVAIPVWQAECSSAAHRGRDVITAGIFMCLGYALCNWIDFGFTFIRNSTLEWRLPLALSLILSLTVACVIFCLPESPRWLVRVNKVKQATRNLAALKGLPEDDEAIRTEIAQIESSLEFATARNNSLMEMFSKNDDERLFYRFCLCFALQFFQQMCGGNLISVFFLFNSFYPFGFLGGNFLYCTEVAPVRLRVAMTSVSTANHWLWNFVVTMVTPVALDTIGFRYYIMYAIISACIPVSVFFFYPETMNRNLELLNNVFKDASSPWDIVKMARDLPQGEVADSGNDESVAKQKVEQKENV
ncbi:hypothetical protein Daus18300_001426 [Diaporthe australafricana]|uniref:Major facilitator superfamily (MFS) profile domain-containing protein n=1 Tax=Diaporthe australafricana TaxID=127596 RepID=A0ABR3XWT5_9PEZI